MTQEREKLLSSSAYCASY